jgi:hypothetical protein
MKTKKQEKLEKITKRIRELRVELNKLSTTSLRLEIEIWNEAHPAKELCRVCLPDYWHARGEKLPNVSLHCNYSSSLDDYINSPG